MLIPELPAGIRPATVDDLPTILELIKELAIFEREPDAARATSEQLRAALFADVPAVHCLMAEDAAGAPVGFAVFFRNFSTWEGVHGIYLEDLFVSEAARGSGLGVRLMQALARIAMVNGYARFEWWVLDWNPARAFYERLGAVAQDEWTTYRLTGAPLAELAGLAGPAGSTREASA